jgi:hypothetical protein
MNCVGSPCGQGAGNCKCQRNEYLRAIRNITRPVRRIRQRAHSVIEAQLFPARASARSERPTAERSVAQLNPSHGESGATALKRVCGALRCAVLHVSKSASNATVPPVPESLSTPENDGTTAHAGAQQRGLAR